MRQDDDAVADDPVTLTHTVSGGDYSNLTEADIDDSQCRGDH